MNGRTRKEQRFLGRVALLWLMPCLFLFGLAGVGAQSRFVTEYQMDADITEVPFEYIQHQIVIHGMAGEKTDLFFVFDTGSTIPVMEKALDLKGYHFPNAVLQEAEGSRLAETLLMDDLGIGKTGQTVHARNIPVLLSDLSQVSKVVGRKIDGIVGITFMAGYVVEVDYAKKILRFLLPRRYTIADRHPDNQTTFLFNLTNAEPKYPVSNLLFSGKLVSDYDYDFILDTGFGGYVSVAKSAAELSGLIKPGTARIPGASYSVSHQFRSDKIRASFITLGEINISNRIIQVDTRNGDTYGQNGIVGNRFLQNYRLTLDYQRRKLWLERITTKEEPDEIDKPTLGLTVRTDGGMVHVVKVAEASPAEHAGVQNGDEIISINGQALEELGMAKALELLGSPEGKTSLEILRSSNNTAANASITLTMTPESPLDWKATPN